MAWSDPGDFTSGQILTAAQMDSVREAMFFGQATFTNEAARDAAIPATGITLQEGMRAYLTAPTVPAATGATTAVPTGVTTIYNGSVWVCVTPVGALSNTSATTTSTSYVTTLTGDGTALSATVVTGTTAMLWFTARCSISQQATLDIAVEVSGATTISAASSTIYASNVPAGGSYQMMVPWNGVVTGLTAGTNTFTVNYKTNAGTVTFGNRRLVVQGIA